LKCSGRFMAESSGDLPVSPGEWSAVRLRRRAFQHERALLAHRWALSLGDRARAGEFLNAAGRMAVGRVAKARVAAARLMFALGRSTEPVLSLKRGPWQEMVKINDYDTLVSPEMPVADLLID
ncbi:MAG: hypothetical protein MH204_03810, partial [Fimbriimonadaceae bacterium]|nr:hypothetical protein [Fimbriimonadaceae bacterium]